MLESVAGFDHLTILVRNIDLAASTYRRLGFQLTERGHHTLGTCNHTIVLEGSYLELLGIESPGPGNERHRKLLERGEGPGGIALRTRDARQVREELRELRFAVDPSIDAARPVRVADGSKEARFTITQFPDGVPPGVRMFACQHRTPDLIWRPEWQAHENGAGRVLELLIVHQRPEELTADYRSLFGTSAVIESGNAMTLDLAGIAIRFLTPEGIAARYPGQPVSVQTNGYLAGAIVGVRDLDVAASLLLRNGVVAGRSAQHGVVVPSHLACGALLEFRADAA